MDGGSMTLPTYAIGRTCRYEPTLKREATKPSRVLLDTLRAVAEYIWKHRYPPTVRELQGPLGVTHRAVEERLQKLVGRGLLERDFKQPRGLRITDAGVSALAWSPPLYWERPGD